MPLVNADAKALEWLGAVYLSKDPVGYQEVRDGVDQHSVNQAAFGLPTRLIAKTFVFRLIYGGTGYSYANDANFEGVSSDPDFWDDIIQKFYSKYHGIAKWHAALERQAREFGKIEIPTGRVFKFKPEKSYNGQYKWPRTRILNYPVQGFGADFMTLARVIANKRIKHPDADFVCTVHDSLVYDCRSGLVPRIARTLFDVWDDLPSEFEKMFKIPFDLPTKVEISYGPNWKDQKEILYADCH